MANQGHTVDEVRQKAGKAILDLTDKYGFDAYAAGWLHDRPTGTWRFLLVTPMLRTRGPQWVYERLMLIFRHHPLPEGISPLDIFVIDQKMEMAAFGSPFLTVDESESQQGFSLTVAHDIQLDDFLIGDGFVSFFRRLPLEHRNKKRDPARLFDRKVKMLEAA